MPKRYILSVIYFTRALSIVAFISFPVTPFSAIVFGAVIGLTLAFDGAADLGAGRADVRHPLVCDAVSASPSSAIRSAASSAYGSAASCSSSSGPTTPIWWLSVLFGVLSALINLPIVEEPVARPVAQPGLIAVNIPASRSFGESHALANIQGDRIDKAEKGTTAALTQFRRSRI